MSRAQQNQVNSTSAAENSSYNADATKAFGDAQADVNNYGKALGSFVAANPYVNGGQAETADNQMTADTAAGQAEAAGQSLQGQAVRTGQNAGGAIAATEEMQRQNERNLIGQEALQTKDRLAAGTDYAQAGLKGLADVTSMQDQLATQQGQLAQGALNTQEQSAQTPSWTDQFGDSFASTLGKTLGSKITG